jgi:hypothetical protein
MDCSPDLSAEHYLSRSVLDAIGSPAVAIDGVPWLAPGERKVVGIENLTAKILCIRHNSALSPLDQVAGQFFKKLRVIHADLQRRSLSSKRSLVIISGEALELWMLKLTCGLFYSKNAAMSGARLIDDHEIDERLVEEAFLRSRWQRGCGLYKGASRSSDSADGCRFDDACDGSRHTSGRRGVHCHDGAGIRTAIRSDRRQPGSFRGGGMGSSAFRVAFRDRETRSLHRPHLGAGHPAEAHQHDQPTGAGLRTDLREIPD